MLFQGQVGPQVNSSAAVVPVRLGAIGDLIVSELHGRFYEQVYRGNVYSAGCSASALSANTISLSATTTPILGVWNPPQSQVNLVMLQAFLTWYINTLTTPQSAGPFVWATSFNNNVISTGTNPTNRKTGVAPGGSSAKAYVGGATALTGLSNNLVILEAADFPSPGILAYGTITAPTATGNSLAGQGGVQNFDGSFIVPPGGVLALLNVTSTTTMSVAGRLMWEEVPL